MNSDEYRERLKRALAASYQRQAREHPSVPHMPEDVRDLTRAFGMYFNLWPPSAQGAGKTRALWAKWLRENTRTLDGEPIDPVPFWAGISAQGAFTVSSPKSTVNTVRAMHAKRSLP